MSAANVAPAQWLALGDSYTIGEGVALHESYPYQTLQRLRAAGHALAAPEVVARTGWTTDELQAHLAATRRLPRYDLATLLIGVNNQYRGRPLAAGMADFEALLQLAIAAVGGAPERVAVLSIPDWGRTPFARKVERDAAQVGREIDAWNAAQAAAAAQAGVHYIAHTEAGRERINDAGHLAEDGLHPGPAEYAQWAQPLAAWMAAQLLATAPAADRPLAGSPARRP